MAMQKVSLLIAVCAAVSHLVAASLDSMISDDTVERQPIDDFQLFQSVQSSIDLQKKNVVQSKKRVNLALGRKTFSSSNYEGIATLHARMVDGNRNGNYDHGRSCWHSIVNEYMPWWAVDLNLEYYVARVDIYTRSDSDSLGYQAAHAVVGLTNTSPYFRTPRMGEYEICGRGPATATNGEIFNIVCRPLDEKYRYVIVQKGQTAPGLLALCEVEVFGDR